MRAHRHSVVWNSWMSGAECGGFDDNNDDDGGGGGGDGGCVGNTE